MAKGDLITYKIAGIASSKSKSTADTRPDTADKSGKSFEIPKRKKNHTTRKNSKLLLNLD